LVEEGEEERGLRAEIRPLERRGKGAENIGHYRLLTRSGEGEVLIIQPKKKEKRVAGLKKNNSGRIQEMGGWIDQMD